MRVYIYLLLFVFSCSNLYSQNPQSGVVTFGGFLGKIKPDIGSTVFIVDSVYLYSIPNHEYLIDQEWVMNDQKEFIKRKNLNKVLNNSTCLMIIKHF